MHQLSSFIYGNCSLFERSVFILLWSRFLMFYCCQATELSCRPCRIVIKQMTAVMVTCSTVACLIRIMHGIVHRFRISNVQLALIFSSVNYDNLILICTYHNSLHLQTKCCHDHTNYIQNGYLKEWDKVISESVPRFRCMELWIF